MSIFLVSALFLTLLVFIGIIKTFKTKKYKNGKTRWKLYGRESVRIFW